MRGVRHPDENERTRTTHVAALQNTWPRTVAQQHAELRVGRRAEPRALQPDWEQEGAGDDHHQVPLAPSQRVRRIVRNIPRFGVA